MGLSDLCRVHRNAVPHERTIRRWHRKLGDSLVVTPVFAVEGFGLTHLHAFLISPMDGWESFPYAVESAWVTTDGLSEVLYLHCVVPIEQLTVVKRKLREFARDCQVVPSDTGWERCVAGGKPILPSFNVGGVAREGLLQNSPLVVPATFEAWGRTLSLDGVWRRMKDRLGSSMRDYFPSQRYYATNGKLHVKNAFEVLSREGLFRQFAVRPSLDNSIEAFAVMDHACIDKFLGAASADCFKIAVHPGSDGCLLRVAGSPRLFDSLLNCERRLFWVNRSATKAAGFPVRFAYESLFCPGSGEWLLPEESR